MKLNKKYGLILIGVAFVFCMFYGPALWFLILGTIMLYNAFSTLIFFDHIKKNGIECTGKILSYKSDEDNHKTPVIEFKTIQGNLITKKPYYYASTDLSIFRTYKNNINKNIGIVYSPKNQDKFIIKTEKNFNYGSIIFMIFGGLLFSGLAIADISGSINIFKVN